VTGVRERPTLGLVLFGAREQWLGEGPAVDFYDGKGSLERTFEALGLEIRVPRERFAASVPAPPTCRRGRAGRRRAR
jgi:phenylalanyl-tRNA synthetase beta subunit